jgi:hypothetical protein
VMWSGIMGDPCGYPEIPCFRLNGKEMSHGQGSIHTCSEIGVREPL